MADNKLQRELQENIGFREPPVNQIIRPFQQFMQIEASSGIILLVATAIALFWANSAWADSYFELLHTKLAITFGDFGVNLDLNHWINDALMAVFFFLVGLEIKRELTSGELSSPRKAILPMAAAVGGMVLPALIYSLLNWGGEGRNGWGIPMATDIAFALGVLALLGNRVPATLKIFLTALAIVDDLGAVLVIAVFYTEQIAFTWLMVAAVMLVLMLLLNRLGVRNPVAYALFGLVLWFAMLQSGVHATIAGVLAALTIPSTRQLNTKQFVAWNRQALQALEKDSHTSTAGHGHDDTQRTVLQAMESAIQHAESPLQRLEHTLALPVAYVIMPIFALANAGVAVAGDLGAQLASPVSLGIILGLVLGKQLGVLLFTWLAVRSGLTELPQGVTWRHIYGAAWLAGIGFTMALFINGLAFAGNPLQDTAKIGILVASVISGVGGYMLLRTTPARRAA
ncbi:MAG: Na+/H+ antiporter NhaA [Anaerolineae bacterium]